MAANELPLWRGFEIHGFSSEHVLRCELAKARYRALSGPEVCALLMNGARFVEELTPVDTDEREEFTWYIITSDMWHKMKCAVTGELDVAPGVGCEGIEWLLYDEQGETRKESLVRTLKVNEKGLYLEYREIPGNVRTRRRVYLPEDLREGVETYHFLQYSEFMNAKRHQKIEVQAGLLHGAVAEASALEAKAAWFASVEEEFGSDDSPLTAGDWELILAGKAVDIRCESHHCGEDEDYVPDEEDPSTGSSEGNAHDLQLELKILLREQELPAAKVGFPDLEMKAVLSAIEANPQKDIKVIIEEVKNAMNEKEAPEGTTSKAPEGATSKEAAPEGTTSKAPEGTTSKAPEGTTSKAPEGATSKEAAPEGTSSKAPEGTSSKAPEGTTSKAPEGTSAKASEDSNPQA